MNALAIVAGGVLVVMVVFYAIIGVVCLHMTKPEAASVGGCINEVGTVWCKMETQ